jgi:hypothetical protein
MGLTEVTVPDMVLPYHKVIQELNGRINSRTIIITPSVVRGCETPSLFLETKSIE